MQHQVVHLPQELKQKLKNPNSKITFSISVGDEEFVVVGKGHPDLILKNIKMTL